jgi:hypothetical protein
VPQQERQRVERNRRDQQPARTRQVAEDDLELGRHCNRHHESVERSNHAATARRSRTNFGHEGFRRRRP